MEVKISKIQTLDRLTNLSDPAALAAHLEKMDNNAFVSVELRQLVPNPKAQSDSIANVGNRIKGHDNAIEIKEEKELVCYINLTKQSVLDYNVQVGNTLENVTLKETYLPISQLRSGKGVDDLGLDDLGNVTTEPVIHPKKNELILFSFIEGKETVMYPAFRFVTLVDGKYTPTSFDTTQRKVGSTPYFDGKKKQDNGRKTVELQKYLNELYTYYVSPEDSIEQELVFATAEIIN